jgi:hypothetical protein
MTRKSYSRSATQLPLLCLLVLALVQSASAEWKEKVLYSFQGGNDGYTPAGGVVFDKAGNLYGANSWGGSGGCPSPGCGTVFELSPPTQKGGAWTETTIYAFQGVLGSVKDGLTPEGGVIIDQEGNLYGATTLGGNGPCILLGSPAGCGIVYEMSPPTQKGGQWTETILYNFQGGNDGYFPIGDLVFDKHGNLFGATDFGGGKGTTCNPYYGGNCGTVFKLSPPEKKGGKWKEHVLHSFAGGTDGANPNGGLVFDSHGAIYGTTFTGGYNCPHNSGQGCGTVIKLAPPGAQGGQWTEEILHRFKASTDGAHPAAGMTIDGQGYLYGTSDAGVFRMTPPKAGFHAWKETMLYTFTLDAYGPQDTLIFDKTGSLYGTTYSSNTFHGTVFRLKPPIKIGDSWTFGILYGFTGPPDGAQPAAKLIFDKNGDLYSTTQQGGTGTCYPDGCGIVFEVSPQTGGATHGIYLREIVEADLKEKIS